MQTFPQYYQPQNNMWAMQQQMNKENEYDEDRIIWIQGGINTALAYMLAPNQKCAYMLDQDEEKPCLYFKSRIDGKPHLDVYDLIKRENTQEIIDVKPVEDKKVYLTKEDLESQGLVTTEQLNSILQELQKLKEDVLDIQTTPSEDGSKNNKRRG